MGKVFSKYPREASHCQQEQGAFPGKEYGQGKRLLTSAITAPVFPSDGSRQMAMSRLSLSLLLHTRPQCYGGLHTHKCVSSYLSTDWTQGNYFWDTNNQSPSLFLHRHSRSWQAAAGTLHKDPIGLSPRWPVGRDGSTAESPASAQVSHTTHPCFGSNSCWALLDFLYHWKTVLPLLVHLKK